MTKRESRQIEVITVVDEKGRDHQVRVFQEYVISGSERLTGYKRLELAGGGGAVNRKDDDTFELVALGVIAKRK